MPRKRLCWQSDELAFPIKLEQTGRDSFIVTYGRDVKKGNYEYAALNLGAAIMHALACEGDLDNREPGER